ncbi:caspase family protein [Methylobacterium sp. Gmos1]
MTSVAIIIWASKYKNELKALPACARDGDAMRIIVENESKFSDILNIENEESSVVAFEKISTFLKRHKPGSLDEVFIYFSGHGESIADDFLYLLPGYKSSQKMSTSIVNSQLDDLVRSLNPKLFVKIVDACESGTAYIKDSGPFEIISKSKNSFQNVFFFSSSHSDEKSYLDDHLSYLTECIVKAVQDHPIETVKYVNILNAAADFFDTINFQRPYIVQQGSLDGVFCTVDEVLRKKLQPYTRVIAPANNGNKTIQGTSIIDAIKLDAEKYVTKDEAYERLRSIISTFDDFDLSEDLKDLYEFRKFVIKVTELPETKTIGEYVSNSKGADSWFVDVQKNSEKYMRRVRKGTSGFGLFGNSTPQTGAISRSRLAALSSNSDDYTVVEDTRMVISGIRHTTDTEIPAYKISAEAKFPNLQNVDCFIVPILSRTTLLVAATFRSYKSRSWDNLRASGNDEWFYSEAALKEASDIEKLFGRVKERFRSAIEEPIRLKFTPAAAKSEAIPFLIEEEKLPARPRPNAKK